IWSTRPADLYGRRRRDRIYTALWGMGVLFGGLTSVSRWTPSRVLPVQRTKTAVVTKRELLTPDTVALTLADPGGGLLPSWTPGAHIDVRLPSGRRRQYSLAVRPGGAPTTESPCAGSPTAAAARLSCMKPSTWATPWTLKVPATRSTSS